MPSESAQFPFYIRIAQVDATARDTLADALARADLPIQGEPPSDDQPRTDPYQVDLTLATEPAPTDGAGPPSPGATYAGLTPAHRYAFLHWIQDPALPAPPAFQRLLIAHVEAALFDADLDQRMLRRELLRWSLAPAWTGNEWLPRAVLLALWLASNGAGIVSWTTAVELPAGLLSLAVGLQCLLDEELSSDQAARLCTLWNLPGAAGSPHAYTVRLRSLSDTLGSPPLAHVRGLLTAPELAPRPWRTAHRDMRFSLPQPQVRPHLQPLLEEMLMAGSAEPVIKPIAEEREAIPEPDLEWHLVLEFGQSRSEYYPYVLDLAQRMNGYLQLLDEDKRLVHRVVFQKREMRRFWRIWDYVQNWSTTHVYLNGEELETWKIWPYSQYLR